MASEETLGINGYLDISDIKKSIDELINRLDSVGVKTQNLSGKVDDALNHLAQSTTKSVTEQRQAYIELGKVIDSARTEIADYPDRLKQAAKETEVAHEATKKLSDQLNELQSRLGKETAGTKKYAELSREIGNIEQQLKAAGNMAVQKENELATLSNGYNTVVQAIHAANVATAASATSHGINIAAIASEAVAHVSNSEAISKESTAIEQSVEQRKESNNETQKQNEALTEQLRLLDELYQKITSGNTESQETQDIFKATAESIAMLREEEEKYRAKAQQYAGQSESLFNQRLSLQEGTEQYNELTKKIDETGNMSNEFSRKAIETSHAIAELQQKLQECQKAYEGISRASQKASENQNRLSEQTSNSGKELSELQKTTRAIVEKERQIKELTESIDRMQQKQNEGIGGAVSTRISEGRNPFGAIGDYISNASAIKQAKAELEELNKEQEALIAKSRELQETQKASFESDPYGHQKMSLEELVAEYEVATKNMQEYNRAYEKIANKESLTTKDEETLRSLAEQYNENKKRAESSKESIKRLGTTYEEVAKQSKTFGDKTKDANEKLKSQSKEADNVSKKLNGFSNSIKGIMQGDFSSITKFVGKIGSIGLALGLIIKQFINFTKRSEEFRESLATFSHYVDANVYQETAKNIQALANTTTRSIADMGRAASVLVKVWDGIRGSSLAITEMIKATNTFAALTGKTSEDSAKMLSSIASAYHMTAREYTEMNAVIATAQKNSADNMTEVADALKSSASSAAVYGVSFKDMAAVIGYSSAQFGGASNAASKLNRILMTMETMSSKFRPSAVGLVAALENLKKAQDNGTNVAGKFGKMVRQNAAYLISNADAIAKYRKEIANTDALNDKLADANQRAAVAMSKFKNATSSFATNLNANVLPALTSFLNGLNKILFGLEETSDEIEFIKKKMNKGVAPKAGTLKASDAPRAGYNMISQKSMDDTYTEQGWLNIYRGAKNNINKYAPKAYNFIKNTNKGASEQAMFNMIANNIIYHYTQGGGKNKVAGLNREDIVKMAKDYAKEQIALNKKAVNVSDIPSYDILNTDTGKSITQRKTEQIKQELEQRRKLIDNAFSMREAEIQMEENETTKAIKQIELDHDKKIETINRTYEDERQKRVDNARTLYEGKNGNKDKDFYLSTEYAEANKNTKEETMLRDKQQEAEEKAYKQKVDERLKADVNYMREYLKAYGDAKMKELMMAEAYAEKIAEARRKGNDFEVKTLEQQRDTEVGSSRFLQLQEQIDWASVFGDVGNIANGFMNNLLTQLRALINSREFMQMPIDQQKAAIEAMGGLQSQVGLMNIGWKDFASDIKAWQDAIIQAREASEKYSQKILELSDEYAEAQKQYYEAIRNNDNDGAVRAKGQMESLATEIDSLTKKTAKASNNVITSGRKLAQSTKEISEPMDKVDVFLKQINLGEIEKVYSSVLKISSAIMGLKALKEAKDGIENIGKSASDVSTNLDKASDLAKNTNIGEDLSKALSQGGFIAQIVSAALDILNILKDGFVKIITDVTDMIFSAVNGILRDALSFNQIEAISSSIISGVGNILNTISFGGFNSLFGINGNEKAVAETTKRLTEVNQELAQRITDLKEELQNSRGINAIGVYNTAVNAQEDLNKNKMEILRAQMGYHSAHHSNEYYINDADIAKQNEAAQRAFAYAGVQVSTITGIKSIYNLTPEQLKAIRDFAPELWNYLTTIGKYDKSEYWESVVEEAGKTAELTKEIKENLTTKTTEDIFNDYLSNLANFANGSKDIMKDIAKNWQEMVNKMIINNIIGSKMQSKLNEWYDQLAEINEYYTLYNDQNKNAWDERQQKRYQELSTRYGIMSDERYRQLINQKQDEYNSYTQEGIDKIKELEQIGIIKSSDKIQNEQSASFNSAENITYEQAESITGIMINHTILLEQSLAEYKATNENILLLVNAGQITQQEVMNISTNILSLLEAQSAANNYLTVISDNTSVLPSMSTVLDKIKRKIDEQ